MSSWTFETYEQNDIYVEYLWDKYPPHFKVFVGKRQSNGLYGTLWEKGYATKEQALKSFKRQVNKIKKS